MFDVCQKCGVFRQDKRVDTQRNCAICGKLMQTEGDYVASEVDIFWRNEFAKPEDDHYDSHNLCLRVAKNIQQAGKPVILCGSATSGQDERCIQARYFAHIHYNNRFKTHAHDSKYSIILLDNTNMTIDASLEKTLAWFHQRV